MFIYQSARLSVLTLIIVILKSLDAQAVEPRSIVASAAETRSNELHMPSANAFSPSLGGSGSTAQLLIASSQQATQTTLGWLNPKGIQSSLDVAQTPLDLLPGRLPSDTLPRTTPPSQTVPPPVEPLPVLPAPIELQPPAGQPPIEPGMPGGVPSTIFVERFEVQGSSIFSAAVLAEVARRAVTGDLPPQVATDNNPENCPDFDGSATEVNRSLSFVELLRARTAITEYYVCRGYITSGGLIPPQTLEGNIVTIQVVEGSLDAINVTGTQRLTPRYIRERLAIAGSTPLNQRRLLEGLQLLQTNPLIQSISADLQAGVRPGTNVLQVAVTEADTLHALLELDNGRSPSVGSFRRQAQVSQANLLGFGDGLSIGYSNTDGSNGINASYIIPLNPRNGTLRVSYGTTDSEVIEPPFDVLEIESTSRYYELTFRQPVIQTVTEELALGLTASRQESQTEILIDGRSTPFPLSLGADDEGRTRISALRFFQEWTQRDRQQVLAFRSQFSVGLDALNATVKDDAPDSRFLAWRGQGQWVRLLAPDTLLLVRGDVQLTGDSLVPLEQFGVGGQESVRGYRQDALLADSGLLASAEVRIPILRVRNVQGLLQVVPFLDWGTAWNNELEDPSPQAIAGVGVGLLWRMGGNFSARLDWGIPLVDIESRNRTWQENGLYFSVGFSPF